MLDLGGPIVTDAATLDLTVETYDSSSGSYIPISQTLKTIAPSGFLLAGDYTTDTLTVAGVLQLFAYGTPQSFTANQLTIAAGGTVFGGARITASIVDDGTILGIPGFRSVITGDVSGSGVIGVAAARIVSANGYSGGAPYLVTPVSVELNGAVSTNVAFVDHYGRLILDQPGAFTGSIKPGGYGNEVDLNGIALSTVTGYSYSGSTSGGTLTIDAGGTSLQLNFTGNFTTASFRLSAGKPALSTDPPITAITVLGTPQTGNSFVVDDTAEVQNFQGTGSQNFVATGNTTYIGTDTTVGQGTVLVDLKDGVATKGGLLDAALTNINGVQLGNDAHAVVLGLTSGTDMFYGGAGSDAFYNEGGTDYIQGGIGTNAVVVGTGNTYFYGNGGLDTMLGGTGQNVMQAGTPMSSQDTFYSNGGQDFVYGGAGTTALVGSTGYEEFHGGSGNSFFIGSNAVDAAGKTGTDVFYGGSGPNVFDEGAGTSYFEGSSGIDLIYGGSGTSFVYAGSGTDVVTTGAGNQYFRAGSGRAIFNDTAANMTPGRLDEIDNFIGFNEHGAEGNFSVDIYMPGAVAGSTSFISQDGGTAILTNLSGGGTAEVFVSIASPGDVQARTHFTL